MKHRVWEGGMTWYTDSWLESNHRYYSDVACAVDLQLLRVVCYFIFKKIAVILGLKLHKSPDIKDTQT